MVVAHNARIESILTFGRCCDWEKQSSDLQTLSGVAVMPCSLFGLTDEIVARSAP
jgi:hypothetical protein